MDTDLFDQTVVVVDDTKDYLTELVGEDKKFKTPAELAKSKAHADAHISNLEKTLQELRDELKVRKTLEEMLTTLKPQSNIADIPPENNQNSGENQNKSGLTEADIERILRERDSARMQASNYQQAVQEVRKRYGDNAPAEIQKKANELGVSPEYLKKLAQESPQVFLNLFPVQAPLPKDVFAAPPRSNMMTNLVPAGAGKAKYSDFDKIRKTDKTKYFSAGFQRELTRAVAQAKAEGRYDEFMNN